MKFTKSLMVLTLILSLSTTARSNNYGNAIILEVTSIYDADTFRADIEGYPAIVGDRMSIRINGIDAPELRGKCEKEKRLARKAKQFTVEHLRSAKNITLKNIKRGKYFRLIADVYIDGLDLGKLLIKNNHAVKYDGGTRQEWC